MTAPTVAMVSARGVPHLGGIEKHVDAVASLVGQRGFEVTLITCDASPELASASDHLRFRSYPARRDYYASPGMAIQLLRHRYDLVHIQGVATLVAPMAMAACIVRRVPFVITFHTGGAVTALRKRLRGLQLRVLSPLVRRAAAVVAVSKFEAELARGMVDGRTCVVHIYNGTEAPPDIKDVVVDEHEYISVGRLEQYKGHHRLIAALPHLRILDPLAHVTIYGRGPYESDMRELACRLGVAEHVEFDFVDPGDRTEMARRLQRATVAAMLSEYEAHPLAVMETVAVGTPALVAETTGLQELIDAGWAHGVALETEPSGVARALYELASRPPRGLPGSLPTWDECADQLVDVYRTALSQR